MNNHDALTKFAYLGSLEQYDSAAFDAAVERILQHKQSTVKFNSVLSGGNGAYFNGNYTLGRISHNFFSNCTFDNASLKGVAGAGTTFVDVTFQSTDLSHASFQSSILDRCKFENCNVENSNFSQCYISETIWKNCSLDSTNMAFSHISNSEICASKPSNLAECCLDDVILEEIRLTNLNLEFAHFKKITMKNVTLPFSQMPYIFGGLNYIFETNDSINISSHINDSHVISIEDYKNALYDMEIFYNYRQEFFPLANIFLAFHRYEEALIAILNGITISATQRDFRMCKYYCTLITEYGQFSSEKLNLLYQAIDNLAPQSSLSKSQYYQYMQHMPRIRAMLLDNPNNYPSAILKFETNISNTDTKKITLLYECIDEYLHLNGVELIQPKISISHNSPTLFEMFLCGNPQTILAITQVILSTIGIICVGYNSIAKAIVNTQQINKNKGEKRSVELQNQKLEAEIERIKLENAQLKESMEQRKVKLTNSGIIISTASFSGENFNPYHLL